MPDLKRTWKWEEVAPDIGDNREQAKPFTVRVKVGLTKLEMEDFFARIKDSATKGAAPLAEALSCAVEMGPEPLSINGKPVVSLADYVGLAYDNLGLSGLVTELVEAVKWHNSVEGARALFYERLSGGTAFTRPQSAANVKPAVH